MKKDELLTSCNAPDQKKTLKQILFVAEGQAALVDAEDHLPARARCGFRCATAR